jgi:hypothetical protein
VTAAPPGPAKIIEHTSGPGPIREFPPIDLCPKLDAFRTGRRPNKKTAKGDVPEGDIYPAK